LQHGSSYSTLLLARRAKQRCNRAFPFKFQRLSCCCPRRPVNVTSSSCKTRVATLSRFIFTATLKPPQFTHVAIPAFVDRTTPSLAAADFGACDHLYPVRFPSFTNRKNMMRTGTIVALVPCIQKKREEVDF